MLLLASTALVAIPQASAILSLDLDTYTGSVGTEVTVTGTVEYQGATVVLYWDSIGGQELGSVKLTTEDKDYELTFIVPSATAGTHTVFAVEQLESGGSSSAASMAKTFTVVPSITLSKTKGLVSDEVTITGHGFSASATDNANRILADFGGVNIIIATDNVRTNGTGSFEAKFLVPDLPDGAYTVTAKDSVTPTANSATASFTIGPVLTITPEKGPTGIYVAVEGRGFTNSKDATVTIKFGNTVVVSGLNLTETKSKGAFNTGFYVPQEAATVPTSITVDATDSAGIQDDATFVLTGLPGVESKPIVATPGKPVTITGENFTRIDNNIVNLYLMAEGSTVRQSLAGSIVVDPITGEFKITLPSVPAGIGYGAYTLIAEDTYNGLTATTIFGFARPEALAPYEVKSGQTITVKGVDFDRFDGSTIFASVLPVSANITVNGRLVASFKDTANLIAGIPVVVPTLPVGEYKVVIVTNISGLEAETTIKVVETTMLTVTPSTTIRDSFVNITGTCFINNDSVDLTIRNASTNALVTNITGVVTDANGRFSLLYQIPANFKIGEYVVNGTQSSNLVTAKANLNVVNLDLTITTGAAKYAQGDKGSFQLVSTATPSGYIEIYDCNGLLWKTVYIHESNWKLSEVTGLYNYPVIDSGVGAGLIVGTTFELTADAPIGNWTWNAHMKDANDVVPYEGKFEVISKAEGTQGPQGPQGEKGDQGPKGDTGASGSGSGGSGSQGPKGDAGAKGPQGEPGVKGDTGPKGDTADTTEASTWATTGVVIAIVALAIGAVAAFLAITLRRRIAS
jgi:hypothetical protein